MDQITALIDDLSGYVSGLCLDDDTVQFEKMGQIVNRLKKKFTKKVNPNLFVTLTAFNRYLGQFKAKTKLNTYPIEAGSVLIKALAAHHRRNKPFLYDITDVIRQLDEESLSMLNVDDSNPPPVIKTEKKSGPQTAQAFQIKDYVTILSKQIGLLSPEEIPELGEILNLIEVAVPVAEKLDSKMILTVFQAMADYIEAMASGQTVSSMPLERAITLLKALVMHLEIGEEFIFDISDVMALLGVPKSDAQPLRKKDQARLGDTATALKTGPAENSVTRSSLQEQPEKPADLSDDDIQIFSDFVAEAADNFETIEVGLVELEQDPADGGIINDIFRPFHTIKGISGFLGLKKINKLSHMTENLLDSARNNEFVINQDAIDVILGSVDVLKQLLERVHQGLAEKKMPVDKDIDIEPQIRVLKKLPEILSKSMKEPLGQILVKEGVIDSDHLDKALQKQERQPDKKIGEVLVEENMVSSNRVASALMNQKTVAGKSRTHVKVDIDKLGDLVDFAGELVIAQSMIRQVIQNDNKAQKNIAQLGQIVSKIQDIAMSMRMIPIKSTFMKMIRLVRDLSTRSGKVVALNMTGEDTEIDRNVVDALYEPMVHMVRNAVDHGLETKEQRKVTGKPEQGNIFLRAYHKGGNIVIEIEDDGKGLDRDVIFKKAVAKNLVKADAVLSEKQIFELILAPGFSTAQTVTDISGRGVGMDVVKAGIEKLRGTLEIESKKGRYSRFTIRLPLTLAIIDGMLVRVREEKFIIPVAAIQRSFRPERTQCHTVEGKKEVVSDRDTLIPLIRLDAICEMGQRDLNPWDALVVVVESKDGRRGLLIDELLGKGEYVIKSLGGNLEGIAGFSGGAILGDGKVGLILDVPAIVELSMK